MHPGRADPRRARSVARKSTGLPRILRLTLPKPGARLTRRPPTTRLGLDQKARDYPRLRCGARFATRDLKKPTRRDSQVPVEVGSSPPRSARRVPQPHREQLSETVFEPEARFPAPGELVERPVGRGTEEAFARSGVCFFWLLFFAQAKKSNLPWVSHPQVIRGRSPLDQNITTRIPACAGMTASYRGEARSIKQHKPRNRL